MTRKERDAAAKAKRDGLPGDRRGHAVKGLCRSGGRCWGPFKKIGSSFPMKQCKICRLKS